MAKVLFSNAKIVVGKLHVVRYCTWTLENIRKGIQKSLLLKYMDKLNRDETPAVLNMIEINKELADTYLMTERFYHFINSHNSAEARERLKEFGMYDAAIQMKKFEALIRVLRTGQGTYSMPLIAATPMASSKAATIDQGAKVHCLQP